MVPEQALATSPQRRAWVRYPADIRCVISDGEVERHTRVSELSEGGARVLTAIPPPVGSQLTLTLYPGGEMSITLDISVVWRVSGFRGRGGAMGVRFSEDSDREWLRSYLETTHIG